MSRENAGDIHISDIKRDICGVNIPASVASQSTKKGDAQANRKHWVESTRAVSGIPGSPDGRKHSLLGYVLLSEQPSLKKNSPPFIHSREADVLAHVMSKKGKQQEM